MEAFFNQRELSHLSMHYLDASSIFRCALVNKAFFRVVCSKPNDIGLFSALCKERGIHSIQGTTRTRGVRTWREIYLASICINCYDQEKVEGDGIAIVDLDGGSSLKRAYQQQLPVGAHGSRIALCSSCLNSVASISNFTHRTKLCLQRLLRRRQGAYHQVWQGLLHKIPKKLEMRKRKRCREAVTSSSILKSELDRGAGTNDYLLSLISKEGKGGPDEKAELY